MGGAASILEPCSCAGTARAGCAPSVARFFAATAAILPLRRAYRDMWSRRRRPRILHDYAVGFLEVLPRAARKHHATRAAEPLCSTERRPGAVNVANTPRLVRRTIFRRYGQHYVGLPGLERRTGESIAVLALAHVSTLMTGICPKFPSRGGLTCPRIMCWAFQWPCAAFPKRRPPSRRGEAPAIAQAASTAALGQT